MDKTKINRVAFHLITFKNARVQRNLKRVGIGPAELPELSPSNLQTLGFKESEIKTILSGYQPLALEEIAKAKEKKIDFIFSDDPDYPSRLAEIYDPPDFIYFIGQRKFLEKEKLAVVGSRNASSYGQNSLQRILPPVCRSGLVIVSGMAYGIDSLAHKIALQEKSGTIGINAGGLCHLYPPGNIGLIRRIMEQGGIISEFPLDLVPRPFYFPIRNRLISGISTAVLVAEAALKSGSLVTARLGLDQGRDIFAIPGSIDSALSKGTNYLIQQGAKLIAQASDILSEFGLEPPKQKIEAEALSASEKKVLDLMSENEVISIDHFVERLDFSAAEVISILMGLILKNLVIEEGGYYKRVYYG